MNLPLPEKPGDHRLNIETRDESRSFLLHIPAGYNSVELVPALLIFHGATGNGRRVSKVTGFSTLADKYRFIAVYPDGKDGFWNDGREVSNETDDVSFVSGLIDLLIASLAVDPKRIFATGISNGAMMTLRLACELSEKIAAVAPVAGTIPENVAVQCVPLKPVPVIMFHGTDDKFLPYKGGKLSGRVPGTVYSVRETVEKWAEINGCGPEPETTVLPVRDPSGGTQAVLERFTGSPIGADVVVYTIYGGGHTWPSGNNSKMLDLGRTSREVNASELIWEFFSQYPKI
jgi:polyhydroxybutyrate depolymerase